MTENNLKLSKTHFIIGAVVIVIILFFVFSNKPTQDGFNYREQLVYQLMGEEEQLSENDLSLRFMVLDFFDQLIKEGYLESSDFDEQLKKMTLWLDPDILTDRRVETWISGLAIQVTGTLENANDFTLAINSDPDTGDVIEFSVTALVVPDTESIANLPENIGGFPVIETHEAMETLVGNKSHAKILDLIVNNKVFAHFETGKVFAELKRLGLIGVMTRDGSMLREPSLK